MSMNLVYSHSMKLCSWCNNELSKRQRTYCSRSCQMKGVAQSNTCAITITRLCDVCSVEYEYHPAWKQDQNTRYCSRKCKDLHQRTTYVGAGNPAFGTTWTEKQRVLRSASIEAFWSVSENKARHRKAMQRAADRLGHWPGQGLISQENRKRTYADVYGVEHPWMNPEIRQKCEVTTLALYGKHTWEIAHDAIKRSDTNIERLAAATLSEQGVEFKHPYVLCSGSMRREFDFYVPVCNTLIEIDGDYHHGNPALYDQLDETQRSTQANDTIKDVMAASMSMRLLRFWGTDVTCVSFSQLLKESLWEKS